MNWINKYKFFKSKPALCYHSVGTSAVFDNNHHHISGEHFEYQLLELKKSKVQILSINEFIEAKNAGKRKIACITFDDGYKNMVTDAAPILEAYDIPYTLFLTTSLMNGLPLWRDLIRTIIDKKLESDFRVFLLERNPEMAKLVKWSRFYSSSKSNPVNSKELTKHLVDFLGQQSADIPTDIYLTAADLAKLKNVTIGNHTVHHFRLSTLSKDEQYTEIAEAQQMIDNLHVSKTNVFGIPFGENGSFNQDTIDLLRELGFSGFLMTNQRQFGLKKPEIEVDPLGLFYSNRILPKNEKSIFR